VKLPASAPRQTAPPAWLLWNLALMILVSAFLLFQVEPLISKFILPWFGGSPAVWTTCLLFFQTLLFGGYAYAHLISRWLAPRGQAIVHLILLAAAIALLPIVPAASWKPTADMDPTWRILGLLTCTVGLPYFVLSSTGPLGQAWFSRAFVGRSPYRLYALSNVGSLAALVTYPFLVEPALPIGSQAWWWSAGFGLFVVLCGMAAIWMWRHRGTDRYFRAAAVDESATPAQGAVPAAKPLVTPTPEPALAPTALGRTDADAGFGGKLLWLLLPACGSLMLLAATNHACQEVAVVPFLWVIPLALYLLSFIICFDHERWYRRGIFCWAAAILVFLAAGGADAIADWLTHQLPKWFANLDPDRFEISLNFVEEVSLYFAALFAICMVCHGELVRLRPPPRQLTEYYLMISAGGALGGIFVSLIAPHVFVTFLEWNIGLVVSFAVALLAWLVQLGFLGFKRAKDSSAMPQRRPLKIGMQIVGVVVLAAGLIPLVLWQISDASAPSSMVMRARNFYGLVSVSELTSPDTHERYFELRNGRVRHGRQYVSDHPAIRQRLTTYYSEQTGAGRAIRFFQSRPTMNIGVVGLGAGTLAAYATRPGQRITFYEINPEVVGIANKYFTFLADCRARGGQAEVVPGDARLSMEREQPEQFDVLVLDAFSGDAPPAHLLTREAFGLYEKHLAADGIIAVHITNHYVNLAPVVQAAADWYKFGTTRICTPDDRPHLIYHTDYMLLSRNEPFLRANPPVLRAGLSPQIQPVAWTDQYSNLFELLKFN
jgi:hypothetical protein